MAQLPKDSPPLTDRGLLPDNSPQEIFYESDKTVDPTHCVVWDSDRPGCHYNPFHHVLVEQILC